MHNLDSLPVRPTRRRRFAAAPSFHLRAVRRTLGVTLDEVRVATGFSCATLSLYERGINRPTGEGIRRLARALSVSVATLVNDRAFARWIDAQLAAEGEP